MNGQWFCTVCKKPVELNLDGEQSRCAECLSPRLHLIIDDAPLRDTVPQVLRAAAPRSTPSRAPRTSFSPLFAALRAAVDA